MNQTKLVSSKELQSEVSRLTEELQMRDQLVQQLSQELFRLVKGNSSFVPPPEVSDRNQAQMQAMREQLQAVEEQVSFYQEQIAERDAEVYQLRQSVQELTDRSRMLEQVVQELPCGSAQPDGKLRFATLCATGDFPFAVDPIFP